MTAETLIPESRQSSAASTGRRGRLAFGLTRRTFLLLFAGTLLAAPGFFFSNFLWAVAAWDGIVLLLAWLDANRLPAPALIEATRTWRSVPALGNETEVELSVLQRGAVRLHLTLIDDLDPALIEAPEPLVCEADPDLSATLRYRFFPRQRGDHVAGKLYLRYRSAIGMVERWAVSDLTQSARIYPAVRPDKEEGNLFATAVRQFQIEDRRQAYRGQGRDFQSLREYLEGDDQRDVCWTAAARRGTLISKQYQIERSQPVWLVIDAGRLLQARVGNYSKLDYAAAAALKVARLALLSGDRVGLLAYGREVQQKILPGRGAKHLRKIMDALALVQAEPGEADHLRAAVMLNRLQPRRSLMLWITDPAETAMRPEVIDGAALLLRRHLALFVAIAQPELAQIASSRPSSVPAMFERAAAQQLVERRELLLAGLRQQGALTLETAPEGLSAAVLNRYLEIKERALI